MAVIARPRHVVILVRDTRIFGGTSLCVAGYDVEAMADRDTRNKSEYDDFIGRPARQWLGQQV